MSRADEIAQGLREPGGALIGGLYALEYAQGHEDFRAGTPPPKFTTTSYDLGRARAARLAEEEAEFFAKLDAEDCERRVLREILKDRPDVLAEYEAKMAELDAAHPRRSTRAVG